MSIARASSHSACDVVGSGMMTVRHGPMSTAFEEAAAMRPGASTAASVALARFGLTSKTCKPEATVNAVMKRAADMLGSLVGGRHEARPSRCDCAGTVANLAPPRCEATLICH